MKKIHIFILLTLLFNLTTKAQWVQTNGPLLGKVTCFEKLGTTILAGTAWNGGGIFTTTNNGTDWTPASNGLNLGTSVKTIFDLAASGSTVYAATNVGIYSTTNNGANWANINAISLNANEIHQLAISGSTICAATIFGVYISTDNGANWVKKLISGLPSSYSVLSVAMNGSTIYAGTFNGLYMSTNNGNTWTSINNFAFGSIINAILLNGTDIYVATWNGVYISSNNGSSWNPINNGLSNILVNSLEINGTNMFAGTEGGLFLSTNNGVNWAQVSNGLTSSKVYSTFINNTDVFAGSDNGIYLSGNNGITWAAKGTGLATQAISALATTGNKIFAGTIDNGMFLSTNNGKSWDTTNTGLPYHVINNVVEYYSINSIEISGTNIFAAVGADVYLSTNNGTSWVLKDNGLPNSGNINSLTIDGSTIFASNLQELYKSIDNGNTWSLVYSGGLNINFGKIIRSGPNLVMVSGYSVYLSNDNGVSWSPLNTGFSFNFINGIVASGNNIFIGGDAAFNGSIISSTDNGATWTDVGLGTGLPVGTMIYSLGTDGSTVYAGTWSDVYISTNNGSIWTSTGLQCEPVVNKIVTNGAHIFIGAQNGVWENQINKDVWPGDANNDHVANNVDLLPIGLFYSQTGTPRASVGNTWQAFPAADWGTTQTNGFDIKHADCNGDGLIDSNDTLAINLNMSSVHAKIASTPNENIIKKQTTAGDIYFVISGSNYQAGDWVTAELWIGTSSIPINNLYGIAFDIDYNTSLVQNGSESITYPNSWLGSPGSNAIKISKINSATNTAYGAITRIDQQNASGFGKIANFKFQLNSTLTNSVMPIIISNYKAVDATGNIVLLNALPNSISIATSVVELNNLNELNIYPNPYSGSTLIGYSLKEKSTICIEIYNSLGQKTETLVNENQESGSYKYTIKSKENKAGAVHFVKIQVDGKTTLRKIVEAN